MLHQPCLLLCACVSPLLMLLCDCVLSPLLLPLMLPLPLPLLKVLASIDGTFQLFGAATTVPSWTNLNATADIGQDFVIVNSWVRHAGYAACYYERDLGMWQQTLPSLQGARCSKNT
jgi:hypothetical protein